MIYIHERKFSARHFRFCAFAFALFSGSISHAAEKNFAWYRFTPTRLRDNRSSNSVQVSEFRFLQGGSVIQLNGVTVSNSAGTSPAAEGPANLIDGSTQSKWLNYNKEAVVFRFPQATAVDGYSFSTANDADERDPGNWKFEGSHDGQNWVLLDVRINGSVPTERQAATGTFTLPVTVPPYASFWHPDYLLKWSPQTDPDADFNRSGIPIASRMHNPALKVNSNARSNEARATILTTFGPTSFLPSQGAKVAHFNAYSGWQYTDQLVFWGGSAGEGIILAPAAPVVDAAHRNGVPVLGNVFFPPAAYGGQIHWLRTFLQKNGNAFPVADKLIEVARYYGFDGWFLNQETAGGNGTDADNMRDFISYFKAQAPDLKVMWYDAMTRTGSVSWQNALTPENQQFVSYQGNPVADTMFLNFYYNGDMMASTRTRAQSLGLDPYSIYAGVDMEGAGMGTTVQWDAIFPNRSPHRVSLAFYGQQALFRNSGNPGQFRENEERFWSGQNGDPSSTSTSNGWRGIAHHIPANTPLQQLPFVTNFNRGQGDRFLIDGEVVSSTGWNNLSLQDILPTWRWIVTSSGTKLTPALLFTDSYYGGTSLSISGRLDAPNDIKLYAASLPVSTETKADLVFKTNASSNSASLQLALSFEDNPTARTYYDVDSSTANVWNKVTIDLGANAGKRIATIGVRCSSGSTIDNYLVRLGRLAIYDSPPAPPEPASNVRITQNDAATLNSAHLRIKWDASPADDIYCYNIFQRNANGSRLWLGGTTSTAFYASDVQRSGNQDRIQIEVEAVDNDFSTSAVATTTAALPPQPDPAFELSGTIIGTEGSWSNVGNVREFVFDGNFNTAFDAPDEFGAWVGLDLTTAARITAIRYAPRSGFANRMPGGVFEGANQPDFSDAVVLFTVPEQPPAGQFTSVPVSNPGTFRFFRYRSNPHCNIAEIEIYGLRAPETPENPIANPSEGGASISWESADWATSYRIERASSESGPFTSIASEVETNPYIDPDGAQAQPMFYRVIAVNAIGESSASSIATLAANITGYAAWQQSTWPDETDEAIIGMLADPDHDQVPNLVEYALGTSPMEINVPLIPERIDSALTLTYTQDLTATGVILTAQWSDDLRTWNDVNVSYETLSDVDNLRTIRASVPAGLDGHRFIRLQATAE